MTPQAAISQRSHPVLITVSNGISNTILINERINRQDHQLPHAEEEKSELMASYNLVGMTTWI